MNENTNTWQTSQFQVHPVLAAVKSVGGSPLFLTLTIIHTVFLLLSLISAFSVNTGGYSSLMYSLNSLAGFDMISMADMADAFQAISFASVVFSFIGLIPTILICVGLWISYSTSHKAQNYAVSTSGVTMIQVVAILRLVGICLILALVLVMMIPVFALVSEYSSYASMYSSGLTSGSSASAGMVGLVIILVVVLAVFVMMIIYYAKMISTLGTIRRVARTGVPSARISGYYIVMCFMIAALSILSCLFNLIGGISLSLLTNLLEAVIFILAGIALSKFKSQMRSLLTPPMQPGQSTQPIPPVQPAPPVQPQPSFQPEQSFRPVQQPQPAHPQAPQQQNPQDPQQF